MPLRGIIAGLGSAFVALGWWRAFQRRARATGTVTRRPRREHDHTGTESTEIIRGRGPRVQVPSLGRHELRRGEARGGRQGPRSPAIRTIRRARISRSRGASIRDRSWSRWSTWRRSTTCSSS